MPPGEVYRLGAGEKDLLRAMALRENEERKNEPPPQIYTVRR